jgi:hypothetical protein
MKILDNKKGPGPLGALVPWGGDIIFAYSENKLKGKLILSKDQNVRLKILAFWDVKLCVTR